MSITVLIAEDHQLVRQGVAALIARDDLMVVAEASNGPEAVAAASACRPDVAVLDLMMPHMNGLEAAQEVRRVSPATKCLLLTRHEDEHHVLAAMKAGLRGYVLKSQTALELSQAIREVHRGRLYLSPSVSKAVVDALLSKSESPHVSTSKAPHDVLTVREREVLKLIGESRTTKEIATVLNISVKTAESHRTRLMQKLDIHSTAGLVRYAIRHGFIEA
jgi:two-component system, NarL family, response regulator NreC